MSVLEDVRSIGQRVTERMRELQPVIEEYRELEEIAQRLGIDIDQVVKPARSAQSNPRTTATPRARQTRRRRASSTTRSGTTTRRRGAGTQRRDQVIALVTTRPGITVPEIAKELGVDPTGLYRIVRQLQQESAITKDGMKLQPA